MASNCSRRSTPASDRVGQKRDNNSGGHTGKSSFQSCKAVTPGQVSSFGVPNML